MFEKYRDTVTNNAASCQGSVKKRKGLAPEVPINILITNIEVLRSHSSVRIDVVMLDADGIEYEDSYYFNTSGLGRQYLDTFWDVVAPEEDDISGLIGKAFVGYFKYNGDFKNLVAVSSIPVTFATTDDFIEVPDDLSELPFN